MDEKTFLLNNECARNFTVDTVMQLFSAENENKDSPELRREKNDRRIRSIINKVPHIIEEIRRGNLFHSVIYDLSVSHKDKIDEADLKMAIGSIGILKALLESKYNDLLTLPLIMSKFDIAIYRNLLSNLGISANHSKLLLRIKNLHTLSNRFINGFVTFEIYSKDIENQISYISTFLQHLHSATPESIFALVLRYDVKTFSKRNHF